MEILYSVYLTMGLVHELPLSLCSYISNQTANIIFHLHMWETDYTHNNIVTRMSYVCYFCMLTGHSSEHLPCHPVLHQVASKWKNPRQFTGYRLDSGSMLPLESHLTTTSRIRPDWSPLLFLSIIFISAPERRSVSAALSQTGARF